MGSTLDHVSRRSVEAAAVLLGTEVAPERSLRLFEDPSTVSENTLDVEFPPGQIREVFCYLLMNHDRSLPQELVATAIWEDSTTYQSKKYLATALLQLRTVLHASLGAADALEIDPLFVRLNTSLQPRSMPTS